MEYSAFRSSYWISYNVFRKSFDERVEHFLHPIALEKLVYPYLPVKRSLVIKNEIEGELPRLLENGEIDEIPNEMRVT